jgi:plasmid stabilization system protein ParE
MIVRPEAEADINEARQGYESRKHGLGADFLNCVEDALDRIVANPFWFPVVHEDVRRAIVRQFPCGVFFRPFEDRVVILAVFHASRDPRSWQSRV